MHIFWPLATAIFALVIIAALGLLAKWRGILKEEHTEVLAKLILDFGVPAMIFVSLAGTKLEWGGFIAPVIMALVELCMIALAWVIGRWSGLPASQLGAVVLCATFGTSATLGYPIVSMVFPNNSNAMIEAVLISEIGVGYLVLTLGPILAMYFGSGTFSGQKAGQALKDFVRTPIFISLVIGMLWGTLGLPGEEHMLLQPFFRMGHILSGLVTPLAILTISLRLHVPNFKLILKPFAIVMALRLLLSPLLAGLIAIALDVPEVWRDDLVIISSVPPAVLNAIYLQRYNGDARLASLLVAGGSILCVVSILLVIALVG